MVNHHSAAITAMDSDTREYKKKKAYFDSLFTVYGRKPVLEALHANTEPVRLHLSERNRSASIIDQIVELATSKGAEIFYHSAAALSRISKNAKQDQGVALDIRCPSFQSLDQFLTAAHSSNCVIALDRVTNPQNLGMIIRSIAASPASALLIPKKGCAPLNSLVIKASAGTIFKAPIVQTEDLIETLRSCKKSGFQVVSLRLDATESALDFQAKVPTIFVLGNETDGVSGEITSLCDTSLRIPMERGIESLNVAVTAALIAFSADQS